MVTDDYLQRIAARHPDPAYQEMALELIAWREHGQRFGFCAGYVGLDSRGKWSVFEVEKSGYQASAVSARAR